MTASEAVATPDVAMRSAIRDLAIEAERAGAQEIVQELHRMDERLRGRRLTVAVVGEHNRGKSSLVNSLIGVSWLPMGQTAPALPPVFVSGGAVERVEIVYADGASAESTRAELLEMDAAEAASVSHARVTLPSDDLLGLTLVDTPGLNDPDTSRLAQTVFSLLPNCDLVVLVLDSAQALGASEHTLIADHIATARPQRLIVVLNRDDELDDEAQRAAVRERVTRVISSLVDGETEVLAFAAKSALRARERKDVRLLARSGFPELRAMLDTYAADRTMLRQAAALARARTLGGQLLTHLAARVSTVEADPDMPDQIAPAAAACRDLDAIRDNYRMSLESFALSLRDRLEAEAGESSIDEIRRFLPFFIQDEFARFTREHEVEVRERVRAALRESHMSDWQPDQLTRTPPAPSLHPYVAPDFLEDSVLLTTFMTLIGLAMRPIVAGMVMTVGPILRMLARDMHDRDTKAALLQAAMAATLEAGQALAGQVDASFEGVKTRLMASVPVRIAEPRLPPDDSERTAARRRIETALAMLRDLERADAERPPDRRTIVTPNLISTL